MLETLEKCMKGKTVGRLDLVQLRGQIRKLTTCTVKNGIVENLSHIHLNGVSARVHARGKSWGFSSTNVLKPRSMEQILQDALKLAKTSQKPECQGYPLPPAEVVVADEVTPVKKAPADFSPEDVMKISYEAFEGAKAAGNSIADVKSTYISIEDERYFVSSEGSRIHQNNTRVLLFADVLAKRNGLIVPTSESLGHSGGLELFDGTSPSSLGKAAAEKAVQLLDAKAPPSGRFQVVIDPALCATLLHEAVGHPLEADLAMSGGGFGSHAGEVVSSKLVTIYDDGHVPGGLGYFLYDDEGVECRRTNLIKNGVLRSFMHDRSSAAKAGAALTGNAHAWDYSVEPLIRQTNIGLEAGDSSVEEMIEGIEDGLFLAGTFGGQADSSADFTFGFQKAQWIQHGKLGETLRGANVAGNAIEVFKTIDAIGKEAVLRPGACGKGQFAVQGRVAPAIRCEIMVGGTGGK